MIHYPIEISNCVGRLVYGVGQLPKTLLLRFHIRNFRDERVHLRTQNQVERLEINYRKRNIRKERSENATSKKNSTKLCCSFDNV